MAEHFLKNRMDLQRAADIINASRQVVILTGAGISTPSGIPDFRSTNGGLWEKFDPFEVASLTSFRYDPQRFYKWVRPLAIKMSQAKPNSAHSGIAQLEQSGFIQTVITQNIDMLHQKAGSKNVIEVHGSMKTLTCISCFHKVDSPGYIEPFIKNGAIPHCPECESILKPDLVLMGEELPMLTWHKAENTCRSSDLMIIAGSSLEVMPVAKLPMRALENGAHLIIINKTKTYIDVRADVVFHDDVIDVVPAIVTKILNN
jgi:NAD-dependent deacetylase